MYLTLDLIHQWSQSNLDIVFFIYGLAFVTMGIAIWVQPQKKSEFKLANILWLLAGFGLIHGTNEFLDMWGIIKGRSPVLDLVRGFTLLISYLFLFEFSRRLFRICEQKYLEKITKLFGWWLTLIIGLCVFIFGFMSADFWKIGAIWARYLLGFPGGLLISFGFVLYYKYEEKELKALKVKKYFFCASLFFLVYGILGGLIVPKAGFFPANWLNTDSFLSLVRIPVQVFRAVCAIIIAWATYGILRVFNRETLEKLRREITERQWVEAELQKAHDDLERRIQERTAELTKANELLKFEITEHKKMEETLRASENKYRILVDNLPQKIFLKDKNSVYVSCNNNYSCDLKIKPEEITGKTDYDFYPKELAEKYRRDDERIMRLGKTEDIEERYVLNGQEFIVHTVKTPIKDENGNTVGVLGIFWDITGRKKAEEEKEVLINELKRRQELLERQKQEIEDSRRAIKNVAEDFRQSKKALEEQKGSTEKINKELDDFTYIVSHDLKEPLRSIDAFSKFLEDDYKDKIGDEGKDYIERIRANATRMQNLIEDLLELSRIERRQNPLDEVEVEELINEVKLRLEYRIKEKNVEIIVPVKLPRITCDRVRLTEVFANLISNAIKFCDKPKPCIEIGYSLKGIFYEFYVKDNGPGIEEQYFNKIFEIFQRLGKREDNEGTGAGLTIAKKIIEMHNGKIWVESKIGEGATFYFTIPKEKEFILGKKKLGEILLEKKLVAEEEIKKALEEQGR